MIVVRVEIWPGGDSAQAEEVARLTIANDGTGTEEIGHYHVGAVDGAAVRSGIVTGHRRSAGALALVRAALAAVLDARG
jgi:hypothetical protein